MPLHIAKSYKDTIAEATEAEANNDWETAAKLYERAIKLEPHDELPYDRAMIVYRKLYQYENELRIINTGIKNLEEFYKERSQKIISNNKTAQQLSKSLAKSLGLTDKKGNDLYHPAAVEKWMKRKAVVENKLGKAAKAATTFKQQQKKSPKRKNNK